MSKYRIVKRTLNDGTVEFVLQIRIPILVNGYNHTPYTWDNFTGCNYASLEEAQVNLKKLTAKEIVSEVVVG